MHLRYAYTKKFSAASMTKGNENSDLIKVTFEYFQSKFFHLSVYVAKGSNKK